METICDCCGKVFDDSEAFYPDQGEYEGATLCPVCASEYDTGDETPQPA